MSTPPPIPCACGRPPSRSGVAPAEPRRAASRPLPARPPGTIERWLSRRVLAALGALERGQLELLLPDGSTRSFGERERRGAGASGLTAAIEVRSWPSSPGSLWGATSAFAESFIDGEWTTPDLTAVLSLFIANEEVLAGEAGTPSLLRRAATGWTPSPPQHAGAAAGGNIQAHYDLGNDFFGSSSTRR